MLAQPRCAGRFVGKGSVELRLEGGVEHAFEIGPGCDPEGDEMTAEHDGFRSKVRELKGAGRRLQSVDTEVRFGRSERGPAIAIGAHHGGEFGDRRWGEPLRETATARIGKGRLAVMVGEVIDDECGDGCFEFAQGTDAPEKRLGKRATCRLVSGARPPERAMFFLVAGRAGLSEIVCEHGEH